MTKLRSKLFVVLLISSLSGSLAHAQNSINIHLNNGDMIRVYLPTIDSMTYTPGTPSGLPVLWTLPVDSLTNSGAIAGGNIVAEGASPVVERGLCWSYYPLPTLLDDTVQLGAGPGVFQHWIPGMGSTTYHVRAYAINAQGLQYGNEIVYTTLPSYVPGSGVTDIDGNNYPTILTGNGQEWMAQNLRTATFANGDPIPHVPDSLVWSQLNSPAWGYCNNDPLLDVPYGRSYNWFTTVDPRNACPVGWHVPSTLEWEDLIAYLGGGSVAGGKLKTVGTIDEGTGLWWENVGATNESGFSAVPAGGRPAIAWHFGNLGYVAFFWTSSVDVDDAIRGWAWVAASYDAEAFAGNYEQRAGFSIRCIKD